MVLIEDCLSYYFNEELHTVLLLYIFSPAVWFLKRRNCLNVLSIHVKALWTNLGKLFLLCLYVPKTHLKSFDYKATVSIKGGFTDLENSVVDIIVHRNFVLCVLMIIYNEFTLHLSYSFLS